MATPFKDRPRTRVTTPVGTRSRTKQANRAETDINMMVARYKKTGSFGANINPRQPTYGDVSHAVTLEEAFQVVADAQKSFMTLPAQVRALAENDPVTLLEMLADEGATAALVEAGLPIIAPPSEGENTTPQEAVAPSGGGVSGTN